MKTFLIDASREYSYARLLKDLSESVVYCEHMQTDCLYDFFKNFIVALVNDLPITMIDSDISLEEVGIIDSFDINRFVPINNRKFISIDDLQEHIFKSQSEITIFTSGTTGQPKKVTHNISSLTRNVRRGKKYGDNIWGFAYNPTHMAGLQVFFQALQNTNTIVNLFKCQRKDIFELIETNSITHISATPTFYRMLLPFERQYTTVTRVTFGGEKSNESLYSNISRIFPNAKINNIYASTEAGSLFSAKDDCFVIPSGLREKFKVVDNELLIHHTLLGKSESFHYDGDFYHSGDLIEWVDEKEGIFRFVSRKNELINVGGYKVNPSEIEAMLSEINGIRNAIVYGRKNSVLGNVLCADIVMEANTSISELEVKNYLREKLQDFKIPRRIKFVDSLPITRTGKIKR